MNTLGEIRDGLNRRRTERDDALNQLETLSDASGEQT
jgi:hypothetical protein